MLSRAKYEAIARAVADARTAPNVGMALDRLALQLVSVLGPDTDYFNGDNFATLAGCSRPASCAGPGYDAAWAEYTNSYDGMTDAELSA